MNGIFDIEPGLGDDAHRIAEPHHQRLLGLVHGEEGAVADDDGDQEQNGGNAAGETELHGLPPAAAPPAVGEPGAGTGCGRASSVSGR